MTSRGDNMGKLISYDTSRMEGFVSSNEIKSMEPGIKKAHGFLSEKNGPGGEYLGWMDLPDRTEEEIIRKIEETAGYLRETSDTVVVVGIGGSYLGSRAVINALSDPEDRQRVKFAGNNMSSRQMRELMEYLKERDFSVNVISKSGTTTEPAIAFRMLEALLREKHSSEEIKKRIICTTGPEGGALRKIADNNGYRAFDIPDDVGGRFSVLTPVGLLPSACAGVDIRALLEGAGRMKESLSECDIEKNAADRYAAIRNILYSKGKKIEILSSFESGLHYLAEWWRQLFGESEGKSSKGIFPSTCDLSTDLHSMGQLIQQGERNIFETFVAVENEKIECPIPLRGENLDNLDYLAGRQLSEVNFQAYEATAEAHCAGGVPSSTIFMPEMSALYLGQVLYFFQKAVAVSAYLLGVNPFDQPGVELYKKNMFTRLGKPGS
jgi:glucose-6-phosphate isomerase